MTKLTARQTKQTTQYATKKYKILLKTKKKQKKQKTNKKKGMQQQQHEKMEYSRQNCNS